MHRLHIWPLSIKNEGGPWTEKWPVSHTEEITCFVITYDSLQIITGSKDMSLKVWQINGGKLSQVRRIIFFQTSPTQYVLTNEAPG